VNGSASLSSDVSGFGWKWSTRRSLSCNDNSPSC
jgi:hypothetical protein